MAGRWTCAPEEPADVSGAHGVQRAAEAQAALAVLAAWCALAALGELKHLELVPQVSAEGQAQIEEWAAQAASTWAAPWRPKNVAGTLVT